MREGGEWEMKALRHFHCAYLSVLFEKLFVFFGHPS